MEAFGKDFAGPLVVLGHGILEFVLVIVMAFGLKDFFSSIRFISGGWHMLFK